LNKQKIIEGVILNIESRFNIAQKAMQDAQLSANEETKSSAGDKYETGRAMAQNERDKYAQQLEKIKKDKQVFEAINFEQNFTNIHKGALANTSIGWILIAIGIGSLMIDNQNIIIISQESPLGKAILFVEKGAKIDFMGKKIEIFEIF
jgi:hypothetical protein